MSRLFILENVPFILRLIFLDGGSKHLRSCQIKFIGGGEILFALLVLQFIIKPTRANLIRFTSSVIIWYYYTLAYELGLV